MIKPVGYVDAINPYVTGKPLEELERELGIKGSIKLASNENPLGASPLALEAIKGMARNISSYISRYPDGDGFYLKEVLSRRLSVSPAEVMLGNGSNELIDIAVRTFMGPGDEAVMGRPSFAVYPISVQAVGGKPVLVPLREHKHDLSAMLDAVTERTRMIFIANPNNPTGTVNSKKEFELFIEKLPEGILVVVDEAYYEYVTDPEYADSMKPFHAGRDILILRTFSKIYGLAGLRIGYGVAKSPIITGMNKVREPFNTNTIAQRAALEALEDKAHIAGSIQCNEAGKKYLYAELGALDITYVPTEANFIYSYVADSKAVYDNILRQGVIIRPMGAEAIRVTIGREEENKRFIKALKSYLLPA